MWLDFDIFVIRDPGPAIARAAEAPALRSEGGMIRLETLISLRFLNSNFSSSSLSIRAFRAYPLIEIRQTVPRRAIRGISQSAAPSPSS